METVTAPSANLSAANDLVSETENENGGSNGSTNIGANAGTSGEADQAIGDIKDKAGDLKEFRAEMTLLKYDMELDTAIFDSFKSIFEKMGRASL